MTTLVGPSLFTRPALEVLILNSYMLSWQFRVAPILYSRLLCTGEDQHCADLCVQEQLTNITSQCHYLAFAWRHRWTMVMSQYYINKDRLWRWCEMSARWLFLVLCVFRAVNITYKNENNVWVTLNTDLFLTRQWYFRVTSDCCTSDNKLVFTVTHTLFFFSTPHLTVNRDLLWLTCR